jgi:putative ABC transport system ATP-binding protein
MIELEHVTKSFREGERVRPVLNDITLSVARGARLALLGQSGSGKSTLLNLIAGLESPDAGALRIEGRDLSSLSERERTLLRRSRIGFVYQFFNLIPTLTVEENVRLPLELNAVPLPLARERTAAMLEAVGLGDRGAAAPDRLSGGEQQRVALARALVHEPALVLADEPTGNLDAVTGRHVLELLHALSAERGVTLLMVTHSREVASHAETAYRMADGRLEGAGADAGW